MKLKLLFALLVITTISNAQTQIGQDIMGDMPDDKFGSSVALSKTGNTLAVAANGGDKNGVDSGYIRIYSNINGAWTQIGQDIIGNPGDKLSLTKIYLSDDGTILAVPVSTNIIINNITYGGYVSIYKYSNNQWSKIGQDLKEPNTNQFGISISLSGDGSTIAVGSPDALSISDSKTFVYKNISNVWTKIGEFSPSNLNLSNHFFSNKFGASISLSNDGNTIAISDFEAGFNTGFSGIVILYQYNMGNWTKIGNTLSGKNSFDVFGSRVRISGNGNTIAVTSNENSGTGIVYKNVSNNWVQIGSDILAESPGDALGINSISANGNIIIVSSYGSDTNNGTDSGKIRIFQDIQGNWLHQGQSIIGPGANSKIGIGSSVDLSGDGTTLAIGIPNNNTLSSKNNMAKGTFPGSVQVFNLSGILSSDSFVLENFNIYPNPTTDILNIELKENLTLEKVLIYNTTGKLVKETSEKIINVSGFAKGIYNVQVLTNHGKATKKVVVK